MIIPQIKLKLKNVTNLTRKLTRADLTKTSRECSEAYSNPLQHVKTLFLQLCGS
jgi:hypothetical protein